MTSIQGGQNKGTSVLVACTVVSIACGVAEITLENSGKVFKTKTSRVKAHPKGEGSLCSAKLFSLNNNVATILVRLADNSPMMISVSVGRIYFEAAGEIIKFWSWAQMARTKRNAKKLKIPRTKESENV